jgi:hypothetical protein
MPDKSPRIPSAGLGPEKKKSWTDIFGDGSVLWDINNPSEYFTPGTTTQQAGQVATDIGQAGMMVGSGLAADAIGGTNALIGLAKDPAPGRTKIDDAVDRIDKARERFTYQPGESATNTLRTVGEGVSKVTYPIGTAMRKAEPYANALLGPTIAGGIYALGTGVAETWLPGGSEARIANSMGKLSKKFPDEWGMVAYHGSPYSRYNKIPEGGKTENILDIFHPDNAFSGEGAQAYGYTPVGYFAENPGVANSYRHGLSAKDAQKRFLDALPEDAEIDDVLAEIGQGTFTPDQEAIIRALDENDWLGFDYPSQAISASYSGKLDNWDASQSLRDAVDRSGHLYEVDIPDETIGKMLDWDAPLSEQPESVREALQLEVFKDPNAGQSDQWVLSAFGHTIDGYPTKKAALEAMGTKTGQRIYRGLALNTGDKIASKQLNERGIPGIRYYDGNSRKAGDGTRNIVPFTPDIIKQVKRDGKAIFEKPNTNVLSRQRGSLGDPSGGDAGKVAAGVYKDIDEKTKSRNALNES